MRRFALVVAFLAGSSIAVRGQAVSLYVTSSSARFSNAQIGSQGQTTSYWTSGIGGGVTLNTIPVGPVRVGVDFRGSTRPGTAGADTAMGGIRLGIKPPLLPIKPYIQASGGYVATRTRASSGGTFQNRYAAWEILGGLDFPLVPFFDLRLIEVGGGSGYRLPGTASAPDISLFTINTGLVFHF
jgi:hypothetical protein